MVGGHGVRAEGDEPLLRPPLILHYHAVGDVAEELDPHNLVIDPDAFTLQLQTVGARGYRFVTLDELTSRLPRNANGLATVTFDDGSIDNLSVVPELLARFRASAVVYACPGLLGEAHQYIDPRAGLRLMTAEELAELARLPGMTVGAHTTTHSDLSGATYEEARQEMVDCKAALESIVSTAVSSFAYPFCVYSAACPQAARDAGFATAVTCGNRGSWDPHELRRVSPDRLDSRMTFGLRTRYLLEPLRSNPVTVRVGRAIRRLR